MGQGWSRALLCRDALKASSSFFYFMTFLYSCRCDWFVSTCLLMVMSNKHKTTGEQLESVRLLSHLVFYTSVCFCFNLMTHQVAVGGKARRGGGKRSLARDSGNIYDMLNREIFKGCSITEKVRLVSWYYLGLGSVAMVTLCSPMSAQKGAPVSEFYVGKKTAGVKAASNHVMFTILRWWKCVIVVRRLKHNEWWRILLRHSVLSRITH